MRALHIYQIDSRSQGKAAFSFFPFVIFVFFVVICF